MSDRIVVLYLGRVMECGPAAAVFGGPHHPYTEALLSAVPTLERDRPGRIRLSGEVASSADPPSGCVFRTRCHRRLTDGTCETVEPPLRESDRGSLSAATSHSRRWAARSRASGDHGHGCAGAPGSHETLRGPWRRQCAWRRGEAGHQRGPVEGPSLRRTCMSRRRCLNVGRRPTLTVFESVSRARRGGIGWLIPPRV